MIDFSLCANPDCPMAPLCRRHEKSGTKPSNSNSYLNFKWFWDESLGKENCIHYFEKPEFNIGEVAK